MPTFELAGKIALVTGSARGIGFATATALAERGAKVVVLDLSLEAAETAAAGIGRDATALAADVTDRGAMQRAVATIVERHGHLDVVVANAGVASRGATVHAMSTESFSRVVDVNLGGVITTVEVALGEIVRNRGHVVVVSSVYAFVNGIGAAPYAIAKAGVESFGRSLRVELAQHGASATVAYFGFIDTEMVRRAIDADPSAEAMFKLLPRPLHKRLKPQAAGEAIADGVQARAARVIRPRRWTAFSMLRGVVNPLIDEYMVRDAATQRIARELDARSGEDQPTTA